MAGLSFMASVPRALAGTLCSVLYSLRPPVSLEPRTRWPGPYLHGLWDLPRSQPPHAHTVYMIPTTTTTPILRTEYIHSTPCLGATIVRMIAGTQLDASSTGGPGIHNILAVKALGSALGF